MPAFAQWVTGGVSVCGGPCLGHFGGLSNDGAGGALVIRQDEVDDVLYVHHVLASGLLAPGWPLKGVTLLRVSPQNLRIASDGSGGAYVLALNARGGGKYSLIAWHVLASGTLDPGTPTTGILLLPLSQTPTAIDMMSDGAGGVFVAWDTLKAGGLSDLILQRYSGAFQIHSGWPTAGLLLNHGPGANYNPRLIPVGNADVLVGIDYVGGGTGGTFVFRVSPDATFPVPALASGALLSNSSGDFPLVPDGLGGVYCGYPKGPDPRSNPYVQYMRGDGTRPPGWPADGIPLVIGNWIKVDFSSLAADGIGGVYMSWTDERNYSTTIADSYLQHVRPDGSLYPGWPQGGLAIGALTTYERAAAIVGDGAGGVYGGWESESFVDGSDQIHATHLALDGTPYPGWPANGLNLVPTTLYPVDGPGNAIVSDGHGGAILAWESAQFGPDYFPNLFLQRLAPSGVVAALASLTSSAATPDRVTLEWQTSEPAAQQFHVQRHPGDGTWSDLATLEPDGSGRIRFVDANVAPSARYDYRLVSGTANAPRYSNEIWVEVPAAYHFALNGARPNPATTAGLAVSFSLERGLPAALELFDVSGRRLALRDVGSLGAGEHVLPLGRDLRLATGLYWMRLSQGSHHATARVVVTD